MTRFGSPSGLIAQRDLLSLMSTNETKAAAVLSARERQLMRFLLEDPSDKQIASELRISESAVEATMQQLFAKTGVRTPGQLVRLALGSCGDVI